jgi:hypothetical protein
MDASQKAQAKPLLGEILVQRGEVTPAQLEQALRVQVGGMRRLGHILVMMKVISDENITAALSQQLKLPVVSVDEEFREAVKSVLPRHLCRKYSVLPLSLEANNVLRLAMADPLDDVAITDVEHYTGLAVQPALARLSDIARAIPRRVALSRHDFFNPQIYRAAAQAAAAAALVLAVVAGWLVLREVRAQQFGTISRVGDSVIFKNHDLMVDLSGSGTIYFSGRGAHSEGYYGVRFDNAQLLTSFVRSQARQLSDDQLKWLDWLLREKLKAPGAELLASRGQAAGPRQQ